MKDKSPLLVDVEVTLKFVVHDACYYSDLDEDQGNLIEIIEEMISLDGLQEMIDDEVPIFVEKAKIIL